MNKADKREFIMFEGRNSPSLVGVLSGIAGQQEYDWERSITLKMKDWKVHEKCILIAKWKKWMQSQEQMRKRDIHTQECLDRVTRALTRRWQRQRNRSEFGGL